MRRKFTKKEKSMNLDIHLQIDEKDISLNALARLILRLSKTSAETATEQVAETAAMGTHSTVPETPETATEQVAESAKTATVPETTFTMFADPEPDADKMTAIRDKLRAIAKNGRRDEAKAVMLKYRVPALSKLDSLTDEELSRMYDEVMAL